MKQADQPISNILWLDVDDLNANDYNPNMVMDTELKLLELSILKTGWVQPILVTPDMHIIDGFHRYRLSQSSKALRKEFRGKVPCAVLDVDRPRAMLLTVRMNRAKGTHAAVRMADMVQELMDDHNYSVDELCRELGATPTEINLLYKDSIFKAKNIDKYRYSEAWEPRDDKITKRPEPGQPGAPQEKSDDGSME